MACHRVSMRYASSIASSISLGGRRRFPSNRSLRVAGPAIGCRVDGESVVSYRGALNKIFWMNSRNDSHRLISHSTSYKSSSYDASSSSKSFKKIIRPFLRACHPDAMSADDNMNQLTNNNNKRRHPLSHRAKAVNLKAVQTINGLIDTLEDLIGRCTPPSYSASSSINGGQHANSSVGSLPELKERYEIEFILPTGSDSIEDKPIKRKRRDKAALTLRSITVSFPDYLRSSVRKWAITPFPDATRLYSDPEYEPSQSEEEAYYTAMELREHSMSEFMRLLAIAGMQAPADDASGSSDVQRRGGRQRKEEGQWTLSDHFLHGLGIDPVDEEYDDSDSLQQPRPKTASAAFFGRTRSRPSSPGETVAPPTYSNIHHQRQEFMNSIPWNKFADDYDRAFADAQADWTTGRLDLYNVNTVEGKKRRERFVSQICCCVRIWRAAVDGTDADNNEEEYEVDDIPEGLDVVAQLIAIRRLSLILYDNFDYLKMEKMGRMWEQLVVVLTPPRRRGRIERGTRQTMREDGSLIHPGRKLNKWERRKRRREKMKPVSRGRMRHVAQTLLVPKEDITAEDDENDSAAEEGSQENSLPHVSESGFKFSYGTQTDQGAGHVTAYIPIDFRDGELVRQLYTHLYDYFDSCCGHVGFLRYGADGKIRANVGSGGEDAKKKHGVGN